MYLDKSPLGRVPMTRPFRSNIPALPDPSSGSLNYLLNHLSYRPTGHLNSKQGGKSGSYVGHVYLAVCSPGLDLPAIPQQRNVCIIRTPGSVSCSGRTPVNPLRPEEN